MKKYAFALSLSLSLFISNRSWAWGQYGHEQVNSAAIELLGEQSALGKCFSQGSYLLKRYAVTPDIEWKTDLNLTTLSDEDKHQRIDDDKYEHPMHFDEVDAWKKNPSVTDIEELPAADYSFDLYKNYAKLLSTNAAFVLLIDPLKKLKDATNPTVNEVTDHGTAPWRVLQMYRLGEKALKEGNLKLAFLYLGTAGHYVGDMSQPFHAALNFDGDYPGNPPTSGIHHEIDTGVLPQTDKDSNSVYKDFSATNGKVIEAAENSPRGVITENQIVPEILKMIAPGYAKAAEFLDIYSGFCQKANAMTPEEKAKDDGSHIDHSGHGAHSDTPSADAKQAYCTKVTPAATRPGQKVRPVTRYLPKHFERDFGAKVLPDIQQRLGASAALLSRIWTAAYEAAGRPKLDSCTDFATFDASTQSFAIQNYPRPSMEGPFGYLPKGYTPGHR